jgi:hypothetical protein
LLKNLYALLYFTGLKLTTCFGALKYVLHPYIRVVYVCGLCEIKECIQLENLGKMGINLKTQNVAER